MATENAEQRTERTSAFVGIRGFSFACIPVSAAGRCLFWCRLSPSIERVCGADRSAIVFYFIFYKFPLMPFGLNV